MTVPHLDDIKVVLLKVLKQYGGTGRPRDIIPLVTREFPELTAAELAAVKKDGTSLWENRVHWARQRLAVDGKISRERPGWWILIEDEPPLPVVVAEPKPKPPARRVRNIAEPVAPALSLFDEPTRPFAEALADELEAAAHAGDEVRLLDAVLEAMLHFGFDAQRVTGDGASRVFAAAPLGRNRYSVLLDIEPGVEALQAAQEYEAADFACLVGRDFDQALRAAAGEGEISLLTAGGLAALVRRHGREPLLLTELLAVFGEMPRADRAIAEVIRAAAARSRRRRLLHKVAELIEHFNLTQPTLSLTRPDTILAALLADAANEFSTRTLQDVQQCLDLLELLGVISADDEGGYASETSLKGAQDVLAAFSSLERAAADAPPALAAGNGGAQAG